MDGYLRTLDLTPEYAATDPYDCNQLQLLAGVISRRLKALPFLDKEINAAYHNHHHKKLIAEFAGLEHRATTKEEFEYWMVWLNQWAQETCGTFGTKRICYVILE